MLHKLQFEFSGILIDRCFVILNLIAKKGLYVDGGPLLDNFEEVLAAVLLRANVLRLNSLALIAEWYLP